MLAHLTRDASASKNYNTIQYNNNCYSSGVALWYIKQINKNLQSTLNSFHNNLTKTFKTAPRCLWCLAPASNVVHILCSKFALIMTFQNSASLYMMLASTLLYFFAPLAVVVFLYTRWLFLWALVVAIVHCYIYDDCWLFSCLELELLVVVYTIWLNYEDRKLLSGLLPT